MSKRTNKSGPVTVITPASALPSVASVAQAAPAAPVAKAPVVALRGGPAVSAVKLTGTVYRVTAPHNVAWWELVKGEIAKGTDGVAPVAAVLKTGVPATMVGYLIRRGYLAAV